MKWWPHRHVLILLPVAPNDVVALQHKTPRQVARDEASSAGDAYAQLAGRPVGLSPVDSVNRETRGSHVERCAAKMRLQGCPQRLVQTIKRTTVLPWELPCDLSARAARLSVLCLSSSAASAARFLDTSAKKQTCVWCKTFRVNYFQLFAFLAQLPPTEHAPMGRRSGVAAVERAAASCTRSWKRAGHRPAWLPRMTLILSSIVALLFSSAADASSRLAMQARERTIKLQKQLKYLFLCKIC